MSGERNSDDVPVRTRIRQVWKNITIEPMFALYTIGYSVSYIAMQNLNLEKACRVNLGYNDTVCDALNEREVTEFGDAEEAVQEVVTSMNIWKTFTFSVLPGLMIPFIGSWSDRARRRKPFMLLPISGEILNVVAFILCTVFFYEVPMQISGFAEAFLPSVTGGWVTMYLAVFSYVGDVTTHDDRTLRVGTANICATVSVTAGTLVSGIMLQMIGYYGVFAVSGVLLCLAFYSGWRVPEEGRKPSHVADSDPNPKAGLIAFMKDFFETKHIRETFRVAFEKAEGNRRLKVLLLLVVVIVVSGPWMGEMTVMYNFTRLRFNWNEVDYSIFLTFVMVINLIGTAITVGVFSHMLKMDDAIIGIISCVSKILAGFIYAFATTTWVIYLAPIVDIANGTSYIAMRSIASKLVPPDELGKLNSLFGMAEAIVPVIYGPMYNAIYNATRQTLPGAFFLIGGGLTAPAVFIFLWLYGQHRQDAARQAKTDLEMHQAKEESCQDETNCDSDKPKNINIEPAKAESTYTNEAFEHDAQNSKL